MGGRIRTLTRDEALSGGASGTPVADPAEFCFQLTPEELDQVLRFHLGTSKPGDDTSTEKRGGRRYLPYVYNEHGIIALAGVLRNKTAVQVSIGITKAFVEMRRFINTNRDASEDSADFLARVNMLIKNE